jgi:signal peptide peptidase SppA
MSLRQLLKRLPLLRRIQWAPIVPVVRLSGVIGDAGALRRGLTLSTVAEPLERAFSVPGIEAVALVINSPGGSPVQSALIAQRIRDLAAEKNVKVYAFCEDAAASGGYWLACAADEIYAMESSIVGSIGVVSAGFGFQDLIRRYGVERRVHASGEKKVTLDPFQEEDPKDVARLKEIQGDIHAAFKTHVRERRQGRLKAGEDTLFSGEFWTGKQGFELGLVDGLGEARATLRGIYGTRTRLVPVPAGGSWLRRRLSLGSLALAGGRGVSLPEDWAEDLAGAVEARALWQRFGL